MGRQFPEQFQRTRLAAERWVSVTNTDPSADGTPENPYNPTSATFRGFTGGANGGCVAQALASVAHLNPATDVGTEEQAIEIHFAGGAYPWEDVALPGVGSIAFIAHGTVHMGAVGDVATLTRVVAAAVHATAIPPMFFMESAAEGGNFVYYGDFNFRDDGLGQVANYIKLKGLQLTGDLVEGGVNQSNMRFYMDEVAIGGAWTFTGGDLFAAEGCAWTGAVSLNTANLVENCVWDANFTVVAVPAQHPQGFVNCNPHGVFSGPEYSALFDGPTQYRFIANACTWAGNASEQDWLPPALTYYSICEDWVANAGTTFDVCVSEDCWVWAVMYSTDDPPTSALGTCLGSVSGGRMAALVDIVAPNIDMELGAQVAGDVYYPAVVDVAGTPFLLLAGDLIRFTLVSNHADMVQGTRQRFAVIVGAMDYTRS